MRPGHFVGSGASLKSTTSTKINDGMLQAVTESLKTRHAHLSSYCLLKGYDYEGTCCSTENPCELHHGDCDNGKTEIQNLN